jgi:hypothetical protein
VTERANFPSRRQSYVGHITHETIGYRISFSFFSPDSVSLGTVHEIFVSSDKPGSTLESMARDAAILTSHGLQHGAKLEDLAAAITRGDKIDGEDPASLAVPATLIGAMLDFVVSESAKIKAEWGRAKERAKL